LEPSNESVQPNALHSLETEIRFKVKFGTKRTLVKTKLFENLMVPANLAKVDCPVGKLTLIGVI
jgi:hypothetical protein